MEADKREMVLVFNGLKFEPRRRGSPQGSNKPADGTSGFYERADGGIHLFTRDDVLEAYMVSNTKQGHFAVTATVEPNGRRRYMQDRASRTDAWLGMDSLSYGQGIEAVRGHRFIDMNQVAGGAAEAGTRDSLGMT